MLRIRGHVQGVSFRYYARQRALSLRLRGWVRNAADGTVEALVQGDQQAVEELIGWTRRGPSMAEVTAVEVHPADPQESLQGFQIL